MDFATLKSRLLAQIGRAPSDLCYELVTAEINEKLRLLDMATEVTFPLAETYTLPSDFLEVESAHNLINDQFYPIEAMGASSYVAARRNVTFPYFYRIVGGTMEINGATGGGTVYLRYYQRQADLSADADTNEVLTNHPAVYVYGVLAHHAALIRDTTALQVHFPAYERAVQQVIAHDNSARMGGNIAGPRPRTAP